MGLYAMLRTCLLVLFLAACPAKSPRTPTSAAPPISGTLADAPTHALGATLEVKPACNQDNYLKLAVPAGQAFTVDAKVSAGSAMIGVLTKDGASVTSLESTVEKPALVEARGQDTATYVTVSETGACVGNTVTLVLQ